MSFPSSAGSRPYQGAPLSDLAAETRGSTFATAAARAPDNLSDYVTPGAMTPGAVVPEQTAWARAVSKRLAACSGGEGASGSANAPLAPDVRDGHELSDYLKLRALRVQNIRDGLETTQRRIRQTVWVARIVSGLAACAALAAALLAVTTPLSGGMLLLSFAVLTAAQLGHVLSNVQTARMLRRAADEVRGQAFECLELIGFSPIRAVLDAAFPPAVEGDTLNESGEQIYPWQQVKLGLLTAAKWHEAAKAYQKRGAKTILGLARATALQLLKGPIAWLTVCSALWDLVKAVLYAKKMAGSIEIEREEMQDVLSAEVAQVDEGVNFESEEATQHRLRLRQLFVLQNLLELPNASELESRRSRLRRNPSSDLRGRLVQEAELLALQDWQTYAREHSDRALRHLEPGGMESSLSASMSAPNAREAWVRQWLGALQHEKYAEACGEIQRFLAAHQPPEEAPATSQMHPGFLRD